MRNVEQIVLSPETRNIFEELPRRLYGSLYGDIIDDGKTLAVNKFVCEYRATRREELTELLLAGGFSKVEWKFSEETGFYQPIVIAGKEKT